MRALEAALNEVWAMEEGALQTLLSIAARENDISPEALEAYRAKAVEGAERATVRNGVGVLTARGAMFKYANLFTAISGATSYDMLRRDLQTVVDDPSVRSILLNIDSPGGQANGTAELAQAIYDVRGKKPIIAYVGGMGASAGYWLASAADKIVVDPTALLGSIGVQMALTSDAEPKGGAKSYRFVSSQSPLKNADPGTEAGAKGIQDMVDAMAQVFVETVARNRGVATETVLKDFGKGGIFVGMDAVKAGLADEIGSFESVFAELAASDRKPPRKKGISMSETTDKETPVVVATAPALTAADVSKAAAEAATNAVAADRKRIAGLQKLAAAHGAKADDLTAAIDGGTTVADFALALADAVEAKGAAKIEALKTDDEAAKAAAASAGAEPEGETADAVAARIAAA